jgi:phi13 family phage major tail protein
MSTIGFKRAVVGIYDENEKVTQQVIIDPTTKNGTIEMNISGLAAQQNKVYASNIAVYVSQLGTGDVKATFSLFDLTADVKSKILGWASQTAGYAVGSATNPPYVVVDCQVDLPDGNTGHIVLLKGKFAFDGDDIKTSDNNGAVPSTDQLQGSFVGRNSDGLVYYVVSEGDTGFTSTAFNAFIFPPAA